MNASSMKTVLVLAVLGVVGYLVYVKINNGPSGVAPPNGIEGLLGRPPKIELPKGGSAAPMFSTSSASGPAAPAASPTGPFGLNIALPGPGKSPANQGGVPSVNPSSPGIAQLNDSIERAPADPFPSGSAVRWPDSAGDPRASSPGSASFQQAVVDSAPAGRIQGAAVAAKQPDEDVRRAFAAVMDSAMAKLNKGELAEVHLRLSEWYGDPRLPPDQTRQLADLLSQLAGTVIYSRQHLLEPAYVVQFGDTLERIAQAHNVPWQLLAKINGIRNPADVRPGQQLKVVRGPFNAIVDPNRSEMVLMLDGRYAGRFPIGVGRDWPQLERQYVVRDKMPGAAPYGGSQTEDPGRPQGNRWIDLGGGLAIRGTSASGANAPHDSGRADGRGGILLGDRDFDDLFDILTAGSNSSNGSSVIIRR